MILERNKAERFSIRRHLSLKSGCNIAKSPAEDAKRHEGQKVRRACDRSCGQVGKLFTLLVIIALAV